MLLSQFKCATAYSTVCSKETFNKMGHLLWNKLQRWGYRRHSNKSKTWVNHKYWGSLGEDKPETWTQKTQWGTPRKDRWVFRTENMYLLKHAWTKVKRHTKFQNTRSPYDGDCTYWSTRLGKHPECTRPKAKLLKRQKGKCAYCGLTFGVADASRTRMEI
ncbi:group II intron maturase-specific domain-containing protein [Moorena sp. SIO4E2]|uniref:group II intron maturase-specific domain-containing protein n=1 Tax=Moorena sp. SIO4E2 TaxID=2607826 RepID=UPI00257B4AFB|nr:group II intron maturase-specific domain-containing protein [Moorena sp. SIO4E2]